MRIRLISADSTRSYDSQLGRFTDAEAIPCFRCGVCCQRWQPLVGFTEYSTLAEHLRLSVDEFLDQYARPYPLEEDTYQIREADGGCIFLRFDASGKALCSVHAARPQACRDFDASLRRAECLAGLDAPGLGPLILPLPLYDMPEDFEELLRHLRVDAASIPALRMPPTE